MMRLKEGKPRGAAFQRIERETSVGVAVEVVEVTADRRIRHGLRHETHEDHHDHREGPGDDQRIEAEGPAREFERDEDVEDFRGDDAT